MTFKTLFQYGAILSIVLASCKTINNEAIIKKIYQTDTIQEIGRNDIPNSDKKISTDYKLTIKSTPNKSDTKTYLQITGTDKYEYDTEIQYTEKYKKHRLIKAATAFGGLGILSGILLKSSKHKGGLPLTTFGLTLFIGGSLLPNNAEISYTKKGATKIREVEMVPPRNTMVKVNHKNESKEFAIADYGKFNFDVVNDFNLDKFKTPEDLDFEVYMFNKLVKVNGWRNSITLSSRDWTNRYIRIISPNAKIKTSMGSFLKTPLLGSIFQVTELSNDGKYMVWTDNRAGLISPEDADEFYKFGSIEKMSIKESIKQYVLAKTELWQQKNEYENSIQYRERLNSRKQQAEIFTQEAMEIYSKDYSNSIDWNKKEIMGQYDADNELYKIRIDDMDEILVKIPLTEAEKFRDNFNNYNVINPKFQIEEKNDKWELSYLEFENDGDSTKYEYLPGFNGYNPITGIVAGVEFEELDVVLNRNDNGNPRPVNPNAFNDNGFNVETDLPDGVVKDRENAFAVVIGNKDYRNATKVEYAINDASSIKAYLMKTMGFKEGNIEFVTNASKNDFEYYFGTENQLGKLADFARPDGSTELFIFYSGHGAPGSEEGSKGEPYFVPVDARPAMLQITGYPAKIFYGNLSKIKSLKKTVVIDACFSGEGVHQNLSTMGIPPKETKIDDPNLVLFTSSSSSEYSTWFDSKQHGLFTYFFLKGLKNKEVSDTDHDGKLSYTELYRYISDENNGLPYVSRRIHSRTQTPGVKGQDLSKVLLEYK